MRSSSKSFQVSVEFLVIIGFLLSIISYVLFYVYIKAAQVYSEVTLLTLDKSLTLLSSAIDTVASSGKGSILILRLEIPKGSRVSFSVEKDKGVLVATSEGFGTVFRVVSYPVKGPELEGGYYTVKIKNEGEFVSLSLE